MTLAAVTRWRGTIGDRLRADNTGAILLLTATLIALIWSNSPWQPAYAALSETTVGLPALPFRLTVAHWATEGLLAIFFFVVGLELKHEVVRGNLRRPSAAAVPIAAAIGGMAAPATVYALVNLVDSSGVMSGWAVPMATDISFAVAVLAVFGRRLPIALRTFLLTLAVVDDLLGIVVIALFYAADLELAWLAAAAIGTALFALLVRRPGAAATWALFPVALAIWGFVHASGIHSTIAGVVLGFTVPAVAAPGSAESRVQRLQHCWQPLSAAVALPVFALFAAGIDLSPAALSGAISSWPARGVALGLVLGKPLGIMLATFIVVRVTRARLHPSVTWPDLLAVSVIAGTGFTVSLLIGELSFPTGSPPGEAVKAAVLIGSSTAAVLGAALLNWRSRARTGHSAGVQPPTDPLLGRRDVPPRSQTD